MNKYDMDYQEALIKEIEALRKENEELKSQIEELIRFSEEGGK